MAGSDIKKEAKLPLTKMIPCPSCAESLRLTAHAQTLFLGCSKCGSIIEDPLLHPKVVHHYKNKEKQVPVMPLGTKGILKGIIYEVVGFATYREHQTIYTWNEYILFNPVYGYAILSEFSGHWNYVVPTSNFPRDRNPSLREFYFEDKDYRVFQRYKAQIDYAVGEFHWNLIDKELPTISEFISPPHILIKEAYADEILWFSGGYIKPAEIRDAFKVKSRFPETYGVGSTQVSAMSLTLPIVKRVTFIFALVLFLIQILISINCKEEEVLVQDCTFPDTTAISTLVTEPFWLKGSVLNSADLEFNLSAPVSNDWLEVNVTLVNDNTGEEYNFEQGVEYYFGYEGGENWSEGSQSDSKILSSIPDGRYHLNISPYRDTYMAPSLRVRGYRLQVKRDVPIWTNLFWVLALVGVVYFIQYLSVYFLESRRWANSEYSL
jgi:hypothetical protein